MNKRMTTLFARGAASVPPLVLLLVMPVAAKPPVPEESLLLQDLINLPARDLAKVDIVTVNLACAEGLPGSETIDRKAVRDTLDRWARAISVVTVHDLKHFQEEPEVYDNSYEQFLVRVMLRCLVQHLGVHYNDEQKTNPSLAKSQDQFVHGLVNGTGGTCASLPTLFVAVGRRLGYPLKLVQSAHHYFARWDDPVTGVSFNIEAHQDGFGFYPDARYRNWPRTLSDAELENGNYIQSLSPREELSTFLTTRADSLRENGMLLEAKWTYEKAVDVAPKNLLAAGLLRSTIRQLDGRPSGPELIMQRQKHHRRHAPRLIVPGMPTIPIPIAGPHIPLRDTSRDIVLQSPDPFASASESPDYLYELNGQTNYMKQVFPTMYQEHMRKRRHRASDPMGPIWRQMGVSTPPRRNVYEMQVAPIYQQPQPGARR